MTFQEKPLCRFAPPAAAGLAQVQKTFILSFPTLPYGLTEQDLKVIPLEMIWFLGLMGLD